MDSLDQRNENERIWLIGLQAGIGLGIDGAREAVLNEMQWENTVFQRPLQQSPSDPDPQQLRMEIGQSCLTGFDRRVAYRMANRFLGTCGQLADIVVQHGLTTCLPETGCHVMGTSMFFSADDVARCHENSQLINEAAEPALAESQLNSGMDHDFNVEQLISPNNFVTRLNTRNLVKARRCPIKSLEPSVVPSMSQRRAQRQQFDRSTAMVSRRHLVVPATLHYALRTSKISWVVPMCFLKIVLLWSRQRMAMQ
ncbi:hypothetical protein F5Y10DRAFT_244556, partial [Nemania abortiva]